MTVWQAVQGVPHISPCAVENGWMELTFPQPNQGGTVKLIWLNRNLWSLFCVSSSVKEIQQQITIKYSIQFSFICTAPNHNASRRLLLWQRLQVRIYIYYWCLSGKHKAYWKTFKLSYSPHRRASTNGERILYSEVLIGQQAAISYLLISNL